MGRRHAATICLCQRFFPPFGECCLHIAANSGVQTIFKKKINYSCKCSLGGGLKNGAVGGNRGEGLRAVARDGD